MQSILASISFYAYVFLLCELGRNLATRIFKQQSLVIEFFGTLQLCAAVFETGSILTDYGLWPYFAMLSLVLWIHSHTSRGAYANPCGLVEDYWKGKTGGREFALFLCCQLTAAVAAFRLAGLFWRWEFSTHQRNLFLRDRCFSDLKVPMFEGILYELIATATCRYIGLKADRRMPTEASIVAVCLAAAAITVTGMHLTGMYFNPILATAVTFGCDGLGALGHAIVYWIGPIIGWHLAAKLDTIL